MWGARFEPGTQEPRCAMKAILLGVPVSRSWSSGFRLYVGCRKASQTSRTRKRRMESSCSVQVVRVRGSGVGCKVEGVACKGGGLTWITRKWRMESSLRTRMRFCEMLSTGNGTRNRIIEQIAQLSDDLKYALLFRRKAHENLESK